MRKVLLFIFILLSINYGCNLYFFNYTLKSFPEVQKTTAFWEGKQTHYNRLFAGHSLSFYAIDDAIISSSFNLSVGGATNVQVYYQLKEILEDDTFKIDTIIVPFGGLSFCDFKTEYYNFRSYYWRDYLNYTEIGKDKKEYFTYLSLQLKAKFIPYTEFYSKKLNQLNQPANNRVSSSGDYSALSTQQQIAAVKTRSTTWLTKRNLLDEISLKYHEKLIDLCNNKNIVLIFIKYPLTKEYATAFGNMLEKENISITPFEAALENTDNCLLLNYRDLYDDHYELFADPLHLNTKGKEAFSNFLNEELRKL